MREQRVTQLGCGKGGCVQLVMVVGRLSATKLIKASQVFLPLMLFSWFNTVGNGQRSIFFAESSTSGGGGGGRSVNINGGGSSGFWASSSPSNVGIAVAVTVMAGLALAATLIYSRR